MDFILCCTDWTNIVLIFSHTACSHFVLNFTLNLLWMMSCALSSYIQNKSLSALNLLWPLNVLMKLKQMTCCFLCNYHPFLSVLKLICCLFAFLCLHTCFYTTNLLCLLSAVLQITSPLCSLSDHSPSASWIQGPCCVHHAGEEGV